MVKPPLVCHWIEHDRNGKVVGRRFHRAVSETETCAKTQTDPNACPKVTRGVVAERRAEPDQATLL